MRKYIQKILSGFSELLTNMPVEATLTLVMAVLAIIGTASIIQGALDKLTWINEGLRPIVLYPLAVIFSAVGYLFLAYLIIQVLGDVFKKASTYRSKRRKAKISFHVPESSRNTPLEIHNSERSFDLNNVSVLLYDVDQYKDRFGKLPFDFQTFHRNYFGMGHKSTNERKLTLKEGGGEKQGEVYVPPRQSVFFYLFELDDYGEMFIPNIGLRLEKFHKGRYRFSFEFRGSVKKSSTPSWIWMTVNNTGERIKIESVESK